MGLSVSTQVRKLVNIEGFLEKYLITKLALKNTGKSPYSLVKSLGFTISYFHYYWIEVLDGIS